MCLISWLEPSSLRIIISLVRGPICIPIAVKAARKPKVAKVSKRENFYKNASKRCLCVPDVSLRVGRPEVGVSDGEALVGGELRRLGRRLGIGGVIY